MQHNWLFSTRRYFSPDAGGGASPTPAPSGGGDAGGSVAPSPPAGGAPAPSPSPAPDPAPAPAATPAPATEPTPAPPAPDAGNPWANIGSTEDLDFIEIPPTPAAPKPEATAQPQVPPATPQEPQVPPTPPAQPAPTPTQPPGQPPAAALSTSDPLAIANALEANRSEIIAHLATTKFALTPEEITAIETDVITAVPQVMARVFLENQMAMQKFLAQSVPGMMKQYNSVTKANDDAEKQFFEAHKGLDINNPQHRQTAVRLATLYRQANPNIPLKQLIAEVGPMVVAAVGMNAPAPGQPIAPPGQPRGGVPFRPAVNGGGGSSPAPAPEGVWDGLGKDYD